MHRTPEHDSSANLVVHQAPFSHQPTNEACRHPEIACGSIYVQHLGLLGFGRPCRPGSWSLGQTLTEKLQLVNQEKHGVDELSFGWRMVWDPRVGNGMPIASSTLVHMERPGNAVPSSHLRTVARLTFTY